MADNSAPRNPHVRAGSRSAKGSLDTPLSGRQRILPKFSPNPDAFGQTTEGFARFMGTPQFLVYMTVFVVIWLAWNTFAPEDWQFDSRALGFTLLTLMLSLQASYAAPLLLLAQNRQDDRDRVSLEQDRQRAERNLSDTEYLTRELASLRIALREVATRDYVRAELRSLLEDMLEAQEELRTHDPSAGAHGSPRDKVKEKLKERRDKQRQPPDPADPPGQGRQQERAQSQQSPTPRRTVQGAAPDTAGAPAHPASPES